jgi:RNA polymerase sigma-70 factor (ECF subfamily)
MDGVMALGENFASVLSAAQTGAEWAITSLYREYQPALSRYLTARAGADGEDLASSTWLDAARSLGGFAGTEDHFRRWLYTIANRRLTDWLRQRSRRPAEPMAPESLVEHANLGGDPAETVIAGIAASDAARCIVELLPRAQAEVVLLRAVAGLSVEDVAELTGRRPGTVRVLTHRALRRLAREFSDDL